jgi:FtsZ-interacting cell division protein ZipA
MTALDWLVVVLILAAVALVITLDWFERRARWHRETDAPISKSERERFLERHDAELAEHPGRES